MVNPTSAIPARTPSDHGDGFRTCFPVDDDPPREFAIIVAVLCELHTFWSVETCRVKRYLMADTSLYRDFSWGNGSDISYTAL
jgi:hypothetical protein